MGFFLVIEPSNTGPTYVGLFTAKDEDALTLRRHGENQRQSSLFMFIHVDMFEQSTS